MLQSPRVRAVMRSLVRPPERSPAAAEKAAQDLQLALPSAVAAEVRWAFTPPRSWLSGVAANLVLSLVWLLVQPLHPHRHHDWVILIGTYFSSFILADVTTTNLLGIDHIRVCTALRDGVPLWRVLLVKNLALVVIVGLPTLAAAMAMTLWLETPARLAVTMPNVAVPIVSWLGVGNLVSVLLPVGDEPLIRRWEQRRNRRATIRWIGHLVLPYALYYVADPIGGIEHKFFWRQVPLAIAPILGRESRGFVHIGIAAAVWAVATAVAVLYFWGRGLQIADTQPLPERPPSNVVRGRIRSGALIPPTGVAAGASFAPRGCARFRRTRSPAPPGTQSRLTP